MTVSIHAACNAQANRENDAMISFTDKQLDIICACVAPIPQDQRDNFLRELGHILLDEPTDAMIVCAVYEALYVLTPIKAGID
jgi:hypothetical protein